LAQDFWNYCSLSLLASTVVCCSLEMSTAQQSISYDFPEWIQQPEQQPKGFEFFPEEKQWDTAQHLALTAPAGVTDLKFNSMPCENIGADPDYDLAFTKPFRVFSDEGVSLMRGAVDKFSDRAFANPRATRTLRGLGYWSKFVRDFHYDQTFVNAVSKLANKELCPHSFGLNIGHTNIGKVSKNKGTDVDKWHFDSVDYVLVIILSDMRGMVGGELELFKQALGGEEGMAKLEAIGGPAAMPDKIEKVSYQGKGWGILCHGSKILHRVTPLLEANDDRVSMVVSFQTANPFDPDETRTLSVFGDPPHIMNWEFARHNAYKAKAQLCYLLNHTDPDKQSAEELAEFLRNVSKKLSRAANIIEGKESDAIKFLDTKKASKL